MKAVLAAALACAACDKTIPVGAIVGPMGSGADAHSSGPDGGRGQTPASDGAARAEGDAGSTQSWDGATHDTDARPISFDGGASADAGPAIDAAPPSDAGALHDGSGDAADDAAADGALTEADAEAPDALPVPTDSGPQIDGGCGYAGSAPDASGMLPVVNATFVSGMTNMVVDVSAMHQGDPISISFQLHFDNETGGTWNECITSATITPYFSPNTVIGFTVAPGVFTLQPQASTFQAQKVDGSTTPLDPVAIAAACGFPSTLTINFANGGQATATILSTCIQ